MCHGSIDLTGLKGLDGMEGKNTVSLFPSVLCLFKLLGCFVWITIDASDVVFLICLVFVADIVQNVFQLINDPIVFSFLDASLPRFASYMHNRVLLVGYSLFEHWNRP